jgi:hypothetical protein
MVQEQHSVLMGFPNDEFLRNLRECCSSHALNVGCVEKRGNEGVIVMAPESVIKIYATGDRKRGIQAFTREQSALLTLGGEQHEHFIIPELKSSSVFQESFNLLGISYGAMTEQSRLYGGQPTLETEEEQSKLGAALGEFHLYLKDKAQDGLASVGDLIAHRLSLMSEKMNEKSMIKPGVRKRLVQDILEAKKQSAHGQFVHGDFRPGNFLWDNEEQKYGILDLTTIGSSVPEQDMAHLVHLPKGTLTKVFNSYREATGYKPNLSTAQKLHLLDIGIAMNCAQAGGNDRAAESLRKRFDIVWANTYNDGVKPAVGPTRETKPDPATALTVFPPSIS